MTNQPKSLRLTLKPDMTTPSRFDGGWWPRSPALETELPILIRAVTPRLGLVRRIGYNPDIWGPLARQLVVDGHAIRTEGFTGLDPYSLRITGMTSKVLFLLTIPPETAEHIGQVALSAACVQNGLSRQILDACGVFTSPAWP